MIENLSKATDTIDNTDEPLMHQEFPGKKLKETHTVGKEPHEEVQPNSRERTSEGNHET